MPRLLGRIALVTGSSSGLGRAIALSYANEGASVMCADLQPNARADTLNEFPVPTHQLIVQNGGKAAYLKTDVRKEAEVKAVVAQAVKEFGRLDIIVNSAGIAPEAEGLAIQPGGWRVHELLVETFDETMAINARGTFLGCKYALLQFLAQDPLPRNSRGDETRGWILNLASTGGLVAIGGAPSYTTSKHAVVGLTKQIGVEYAKDKIHCNALCPSFIDTALIAAVTRDFDNPIAVGTTQTLMAAHPWGTLGQAEDVARAAVFLVSEDAQWITAVPLIIDGGYIAR